MRDHLEIDSASIHILQTSRAEISKLRLLCGDECRIRAPSLAGSLPLHHLSEPIGQEMFFDRNGSHAHSSSRKRCSIESSESSRVDTIPLWSLSNKSGHDRLRWEPGYLSPRQDPREGYHYISYIQIKK